MEPLNAWMPGSSASGPTRLVLVEDPDVGTVAVRWQLDKTPRWRCRECGHQDHTDCVHTFSAGLYLASAILGLRPSTTTESLPTEGATA